MRRAAMLQRIEQKAELAFTLLAHVHRFEHGSLHCFGMNPQGTTTEFVAVQHDIIRRGPSA